MKTTIKRKTYDTDKATKIASSFSGEGRDDFNFRCDTLYLTPNGVHFLHREGGAMTDLAEHSGRNTYGGEIIEPVSREEACDWCALNRCNEAIAEHFADLCTDA